MTGRAAGAPAGGPLLLALDTSSDRGSVAVGRAAHVLARAVPEARTGQAATLVPVVAQALRDAGVARQDIAGIVVGEGPGSFTGVRVAGATAKGLARALGVPMWAVSSLAAAALGPASMAPAAVPPVRYVLFDARADRVYGACYRIDPDTGRAEELVAPHGGALEAVLEGPLPGGVVFTGDAAWRHRARLEDAGHTVVDPPSGLPSADALLAWWAAHPDIEPVGDTDTWEPRYVRASNAERAWAG
ncbi:MAG: tRNA (adenosine(37)-N6)-threonylcarbamoyltransferase complex dimerization subunit type 1 TsaB [Longimicrobiales bacterium]